MIMDSDAAKLLAMRVEVGAPTYESLTPEEARDAMTAARIAANVTPPEVGEIQNFAMNHEGGTTKLRYYRPDGGRQSGKLPLLVFFHGGGWVIGDLDTHDMLCRQITNSSGVAILSVDYRLAPEHKFPAAVDDAAEAVRWAFANTDMLDIDADRVAVGGDSAGGNLAAVMAIFARDGTVPELRFQLLVYPCTDLTMSRRSYDVAAEGLPVTADTMFWFRDHYLENFEQQVDWRASPVFAPTLKDVAPAYVVTVGFDPLADEGESYVRRLRQAGVSVEYKHYPGQIHGFVTLGNMLPTAEAAVTEISQRLRAGLFGEQA